MRSPKVRLIAPGNATLVLVLLLMICVGSALPVWAQSLNAGTVVGTVTDASAAVVADAAVTLTDKSTKNARTVNTNSAGRYIFVDVAPGNYELSVSKQGFSTAKTSAEVRIGSQTTLNMSMQVGGGNTVVEVTAVGTELQTMNATVGNTVDSRMLDALPSIGRDVSTFVELQPGVTPEGSVAGTVNDQTFFSLDGGNNTGRDRNDRSVSNHFRKTSKSPVVLDNRRGHGFVSAHALREYLLRVVGSLDQRRTFNVADSIHLRRIAELVVDALADRTIPATRNPAQ